MRRNRQTITLGDFNCPLSITDRASTQSISKSMNVSNNTINHLAQANSTDHCDQRQQECTGSTYQDKPTVDAVTHSHECKRNKVIKKPLRTSEIKL